MIADDMQGGRAGWPELREERNAIGEQAGRCDFAFCALAALLGSVAGPALAGKLEPPPGLFRDLTDPDPKRRYKMLYCAKPDGTAKSLCTDAAYSPDGIHWTAERVWAIWVPSDRRDASSGGLSGEPQAGGASVATRRAKGPAETAQTGSAMAQ